MIFQNSLRINGRCLPLRYPKLLPLSICLRCATSFSSKPVRLPCAMASLPVRLSDRLMINMTSTGPNQECPKRHHSTPPKDHQDSTRTSLSEAKGATPGSLTVGEKVKQTTKDAYYMSIIIAGVAVTGFMFYTIFRELFSKQSPNGVYTEAFKLCKENPKITDAIGEPIKGHGETTSRGRRRHVSHVEFEKDGVKCMRMKFYVQGSRRRGTVHLEVQQNDQHKYEYRYLFVDLDDYPRETIILEDNR